MQANTCAVILAGGRGTRISHLHPDVPKPMIEAAGKPFIEWVVRYLAQQGVGRLVISLGHLAHVAEKYFAERADDGLTISTVREPSPMGTGGALLYAVGQCEPSEIVVLTNGDSLVMASLDGVWPRLADPLVDGLLVAVEVDDASRYGGLEVSQDGFLTGFREKQPGRGLINAGVYFLKRRLLDAFPQRMPLSMETEVFPTLLAGGARLAVFPCRAPFLDIGTPESIGEASCFIEQYFSQEVQS
jgi:D-glycero-alpha-D-manno-heptose 1-phosphate guanylyltransferase